MDWRIKGAVQGILARLPLGCEFNDFLQRAIGGRRNFADHCASKIRDDWIYHVEVLRSLDFQIKGCRILEIGTGWLPILPLCYHLAGASRCLTFDLNYHMKSSALPKLIRALEAHILDIAIATSQPEDEVRARWQRLREARDAKSILELAGLSYFAPADATKTGLSSSSIDLVFSNSVLEHVSVDAICPLFIESRRLLSPGGVMLHTINCGDHYAYFDKSISAINYLRFDSSSWAKWNNNLLYQNRLRPTDFIAATEKCGLNIVFKIYLPKPKLLELLEVMPLASEFSHYAKEDLCSTSVTIASRT